MGLDANSARFLIAARKKGAQFGRTMMLGRQNFFVPPGLLCDYMAKAGLATAGVEESVKSSPFAEPFFKALGATQVDSMDNATFEGANFIHDLNVPIPDAWKEQYDAVCDGGTMEHVFNFPTALHSAMELLKKDGRLFIHTPVNNTSGHGFYQFSPEMFYAALGPDNGFEVERLVLHRPGPYGRWFQVSNPDVIRDRVELITFTPVMALVQARRVEVKPIFQKWPQQVLYSDMWKAGEHIDRPHWFRAAFPRLARWLSPFQTAVKFYSRQSLMNRKLFKPVDK
ncbi:MAG TPA: methyltransferase domain-containing protein [Verrucomicrobiae bacterium]|nr:methyltransferase domain-containing protein [Verrucomicrobiae bacterium]